MQNNLNKMIQTATKTENEPSFGLEKSTCATSSDFLNTVNFFLDSKQHNYVKCYTIMSNATWAQRKVKHKDRTSFSLDQVHAHRVEHVVRFLLLEPNKHIIS